MFCVATSAAVREVLSTRLAAETWLQKGCFVFGSLGLRFWEIVWPLADLRLVAVISSLGLTRPSPLSFVLAAPFFSVTLGLYNNIFHKTCRKLVQHEALRAEHSQLQLLDPGLPRLGTRRFCDVLVFRVVLGLGCV